MLRASVFVFECFVFDTTQDIELLEDDFVEVVDLGGEDEAEEGTTIRSR